MRPTLALAMITLNSEKNLPALFESISGCFDKIYVTDDSKTTDETRRICKAYNCIITTYNWCDDFSKARQASFDEVKEDYICWLDSDDVLVEKDKFLHWRDNIMETRELWMVPYLYAPGIRIERERVVKRSCDLKWRYPIHECIHPFGANGKIVKCGRTTEWLVKHTRTEFKSSNKRNLRIFKMNEDNLDSHLTWMYGKELCVAGRFDQAIQYLKKALNEPDLDDFDTGKCKIFLAMALRERELLLQHPYLEIRQEL